MPLRNREDSDFATISTMTLLYAKMTLSGAGEAGIVRAVISRKGCLKMDGQRYRTGMSTEERTQASGFLAQQRQEARARRERDESNNWLKMIAFATICAVAILPMFALISPGGFESASAISFWSVFGIGVIKVFRSVYGWLESRGREDERYVLIPTVSKRNDLLCAVMYGVLVTYLALAGIFAYPRIDFDSLVS